MSIQEVSPEQFAKLFHHYHEVLAPDGCTNEHSSDSWSEVPACEKRRMIIAAQLALLELASGTDKESGRRSYFARPGQAEWGC